MRQSRILQASLLVTVFLAAAPGAWAQLFTNLNMFVSRLPTGDPSIQATNSLDGPKGICTADFDNDLHPDLAVANTDGTVTLFYGLGQAHFAPPIHLQTGEQELRGITCGDITGDGRPDIAVAAPYAGQVFLFVNQNGSFGPPISIPTWAGARNVVTGDFDGDGLMDLVVAGTTNGVQQLRSLGAGDFEVVTNLVQLGAFNEDFPKPVYSMAAFRPDGGTRDELVVTHADSEQVWVLAPGTTDALEIQGTFNNQNAHDMAVGALTDQANSTQLDLVIASRDFGTIEIHRGIATPERFEQGEIQRIEVPGGPRAVQIVDLNEDNWNDLVVVLRNFDRVLTYQNSNGVLIASKEMPVGTSPRELVVADFDEDELPDVAVMNRDSRDVSLLLNFPGETGFQGLDLIYPVDGEVSGLSVFDFNRDGRDDVVQLHRASAEFSVRLAQTNGVLAGPTFYSMGALPSAQATTDVNNDQILDIVTANLGQGGEGGSVSVRLGDGLGGFGEEQRYFLPSENAGSLFALVAADFDRDGNVDLAAGFFDCRLAFFKGHGDGSFSATQVHRFVYESRVMVAGDFDQDGDIDLAGAGYAGDVVVVENLGDLLTTSELTRVDYPTPSKGKFGTRDIVAADVNGDDDLDLLVGSGDGTMMFFGGEGMEFTRVSDGLPGTEFPNSAVAVGDFDGDGSRDLVVSCRILACISVLVQDTNGNYQISATVTVPSGTYLASGDLDGDGQVDLVGSGSVLWTALSSRRGQITPPPIPQLARASLNKPVINELLAINSDWPLKEDGDRRSDWVELFNGTETATSLNGWRLILAEDDGTGLRVTNDFTFPPTAFFPSQGHLVVIFSEDKRTIYHTGFRLPGAGGVLALLNPAGVEIDCVVYPSQQENVAYGRYADGLPALAANPYPSPGRPNTDNGPVDPAVRLEDIAMDTLEPGQPIRFSATAADDVGVIGVSVLYQRLDIADPEAHRVALFDDGAHDDGELLDGLFAGTLEEGLPLGAEIQFYIEAVDLSDNIVIEPDEPVFNRRSGAVTLFSLAMGAPVPSLEISEVVASNLNGLLDEQGGHPDWVEVRNCSSERVPLSGLQLATRFFGNSSRFKFGADDFLFPGEHRVILCDRQSDLGPTHAPFELAREGDRVVLTGLTDHGARILVDEVAFGAQLTDIALARLECGGPWRSELPTPEEANVPGAWLGIVQRKDSSFTLAFPTKINATYTVEYTDSITLPVWTALPSVAGDGIEKAITQPLVGQRYYRITEEESAR